MKLQDSGEFVGKRIFLKHKDDGWIEGTLESIEENGILMTDTETYYDDDGDEKEEITTYFIPHHNVSYMKYSPHAYYDDDTEE